jgi:hypothetical protein
MTKKRASNKRKWPSELKGPFPMRELEDQAIEAAGELDNSEHLYTRFLRELWKAKTKQRVALIVQFFNKPWPQNEDGWLELIFLICARFEAPGFRSGQPGARKKWGGGQNARLFADVMSVTNRKKIKAYPAVKYITANSEEFLNRYSKYQGETRTKTLYDQFLRAKKVFDRTEHVDRLSGRPLSRKAAIKQEIEFYSVEAHRKHKHQITQKSGKPKNP